ncbi:sugar phosphate isomerase/epimerase family protein [Sphingorhabdus sp. 109]|jgi:sugar phosphate isomerase/epimerase|uniref:sugar phosphate isomerase/epimerase family protein n=1 Tax=Sphingorhabdus sp. 109 TaxID=2653173 RepID=UPI0012EFE217|nr:sugar phosphate isomerase/epimerase [Sphingorhabdus sp. 109]VWX61401.1 Xylose isomerase-like TIM barrel [Sphingorhabdus sp. 109]
MREPALHQITMMEGGPEGLVRFAADAGLAGVCLFTTSPLDAAGRNMFPLVSADAAPSFGRLLRDHHVSVINAEYFPVMAGRDVADYLPAISLAAEIGARRLVSHVHDTDPHRAEDQLSHLCTLARAHDLDVGLEFTGFAAGCNSLQKAVALHTRLAQPNLAIAIDALHLFRTGGTIEQLRSVDPAIIGYAQLCDGPALHLSADYLDEAMNRMVPGEGVFPLRELVSLLGSHVDIDIEVPAFMRPSKISARDWAQRAIRGSRRLLG